MKGLVGLGVLVLIAAASTISLWNNSAVARPGRGRAAARWEHRVKPTAPGRVGPTAPGRAGPIATHLKCPMCGSRLAVRKPAVISMAVNINGKTYYCTACGAAISRNQGPPTRGPMSCPWCQMKLTSRPDKKHTAPININGKTYYCCTGCNMPSK